MVDDLTEFGHHPAVARVARADASMIQRNRQIPSAASAICRAKGIGVWTTTSKGRQPRRPGSVTDDDARSHRPAGIPARSLL